MGSLNMWDIKKNGEWGRTQYSFWLRQTSVRNGFGFNSFLNRRWSILLSITKEIWKWTKSWGLCYTSDLLFYDRHSKWSIYCKKRDVIQEESCDESHTSVRVTVVIWATKEFLRACIHWSQCFCCGGFIVIGTWNGWDKFSMGVFSHTSKHQIGTSTLFRLCTWKLSIALGFAGDQVKAQWLKFIQPSC